VLVAERRDAAEFLRDLLRNGPMRAKEVYASAKANGISERTLNRAKADLGVLSDKTGQPGKDGQEWHWMMPASKHA
jgi:hypothetical protein